MASSNYGSSRIQQTQREVDDVLGVMRNNVDKVLERDGKLSELDQRAENLQVASSSFATNSTRLKKKYWWQNLKMKLIIGGVVLLVVIIIITIIVVKTTKGGGDSNPPAVTTLAPEKPIE